MPWNDKNTGGGGPWGQGGGSGGGSGGGRDPNNPWGRPNGGRGGGQEPPDLDELVGKLQDGLRGMFGGKGGGDGRKASGGGKGGGSAGIGLLIAVVAAVWLLWPGSAWYVVGPQQMGVVLRFGEYDRTTPSGLRLKLPWPVETVEIPDVTSTRSIDIGATDQESLMLTRDENIVDIDFVVQWRVDSSYPDGVRDFLFNVRDPERAVKAVAESAMREVVGQTDLQPIITVGRAEVARRTRDIIQTTLSNYEAGIQILEVQLREATAPGSVIEAFRDVDAARQDAERVRLNATQYANEVVPRARGQAARVLQGAQAYRDSVIAEAQGQADRFVAIYDEYAIAPEVTRRRMFLETMERVLGRSELIILDQAAGAVPYLPLDQLGRNRAAAQPSQPAQGNNR